MPLISEAFGRKWKDKSGIGGNYLKFLSNVDVKKQDLNESDNLKFPVKVLDFSK